MFSSDPQRELNKHLSSIDDSCFSLEIPPIQGMRSKDDSCTPPRKRSAYLVIHRFLSLPNPLNFRTQSLFPPFNTFKKFMREKKRNFYANHQLVDSEVLYTVLQSLSLAFSMHPERLSMLTRRLLLNEYTRSGVQKELQMEFNIAIGDYEAETLVHYAVLFTRHCDSVQPFSDLDYDDFSLLLPHQQGLIVWCNVIDEMATRIILQTADREELASLGWSLNNGGGYDSGNIAQYREVVRKNRPKRVFNEYSSRCLRLQVAAHAPLAPSRVVPVTM